MEVRFPSPELMVGVVLMIPSDQELLFTLFVPAGRPLPLPVLHGIAVEGQNAGHFFAFLPRLWVFALPLDL